MLADIEQQVDLSRIGSVAELCQALAAVHGRPLFLYAERVPPPANAVWYGLSDEDVIIYAPDAPAILQLHMLAHELAHMVLGHHPLAEHSDQGHVSREALFHYLDEEHVQDELNRSHYDTIDEQEAELLATLLEQRWFAAREAQATTETSRQGGRAAQWLEQQARGRLDASDQPQANERS